MRQDPIEPTLSLDNPALSCDEMALGGDLIEDLVSDEIRMSIFLDSG